MHKSSYKQEMQMFFIQPLKKIIILKLKVISSFKEVEHEIIYGISLIFKETKRLRKHVLKLIKNIMKSKVFKIELC